MTSLDDLDRMYEWPGPFVSIYIDTTSNVEHAQRRLDTRWRNLRRGLARAGADEPTLVAVDSEVMTSHTPGDMRVVIAAGGAVLHVSNHSEPPNQDVARWSALPSVGLMVAARQATKRHLIVLTDRTGADIVANPGHVGFFAVTVGDNTDRIGRPTLGGVAQPGVQQHSDDQWQQNSAIVAATLVGVVDDVHPDLIVVAGDARSVQLLRQLLPKRVRDRVTVVDGDRSAGINGAVVGRVASLVQATVAEETTAILAAFGDERGQGNKAVDGPGATIRALSRGQVATLLVHDDPADRRRAWFGPEPMDLATSRRALRANGVREPRKGRLADVVLRAALGTSADVLMLPAPRARGPQGGIGALLRYR